MFIAKPKTLEIFKKVTLRNKNFFHIFERKSLLAYSGGKDSTLLLQYYLFLNKEFGFPKPSLFHLQHCIRNNSFQEQEIQTYMNSLGLEVYFYKKHIPKIAKKIKKSLEETGRFVRYALLKKIANKKNYIITTGHHRLDYFESVLIHLIRGGGKQAFSTLNIFYNNIFRPLLLFEYSEIQEILNLEDWKIFEDETNTEEVYLRNRVRKKIIPLFLQEGLNLDKIYKNFHEFELYELENLNTPTYAKIYLIEPFSLHFLKQALDVYLTQLKLHPITLPTLKEIFRQLEKGFVVYVENKEAIFWKSKKNTLYIIPKKSKILQKPRVIKNTIYWNNNQYILQNETLCETRIGKKILLNYGSKEISEIFREKNIPTPIRENIPIIEKNGKVIKILLSFWDKNLKDIVAYEKRKKN